MDFGVQVRATAEGVDLRWIARAVEERGFESLFLPEHTHVPAVRRSVHPGGEELMDAALKGYDPFIGLAVVAASTERLRIGTGVCLIPQHDPIVLAKQVATLDVLSGGRVILGVGAGWNREEMANHGVEPNSRWDVMREKVLAVKRIWTEGEASFDGTYVRFGAISQEPKPIQCPHPPVLIGGEAPGVLERVASYGDGWLPNDHPELLDRIPGLQELAAAVGRGPLPVSVYAMPHDADAVARYAEAARTAGIDRCVFNLPSRDIAETTSVLDRLAEIVRQLS
jgi:probable F420-dependent oxidoreductase